MESCSSCGADTFRRGKERHEREVSGLTFTAELPAETCTACGVSRFRPEVLSRWDLAVAGELARLGHRSHSALRFMRQALDLKSMDLARLFEVRAETVSRWEAGALPVEARAFVLLGSLVHDALEGRDTTLRLLRALAEPPSVAAEVKVRLPRPR
jgi:putative zinc finger/helix-turn-helix YgiT family protein